MSDWVMFLRDDGTKKAYKTFKQELEDERAYNRRKSLFDKVKEYKESQKPKVDEGMKRRQETLKKYESFIEDMTSGKKKNMKHRKKMIEILKRGASKVMNDDELKELRIPLKFDDISLAQIFKGEEIRNIRSLLREYGIEEEERLSKERVISKPPEGRYEIIEGGYRILP